MALGHDFRQELYGPWTSARSFLVEQFDRLYAALVPIGPLIDGLAASVTNTNTYPVSSVLTTNTLGAPSFTTTLPMPLGFVPATTLTPTALAANTNDYAPTGLAGCTALRIASTGAINVTGLLAAPALSVCHLLINIGAFTITLTNADAASVAANRWRCPGAANYGLTTGQAIWIWYDTTSTVWQVVA